MDFYSLEFFIFFLIVATFYFLSPGRFRWVILLGASYYFYGAFKKEYLVFIIASTLVAYITAILMGRMEEKSCRKIYLFINLFCNLGLLLVMKYCNFFLDSVLDIFNFLDISYKSPVFKIIAPVGISFYVFQIVSYSIDVYRGQIAPEKHIGIFALYVAFFPKLLAGPIERAKQFLIQFHQLQRWDWERVTGGLKLMVWGLFKKVVIADRIAALVDPIFTNPGEFTGPSFALASFLYTFQIYCDFSGYTDTAIGISQVFGYKLMDNFNRPYSARSIAEFWRRWHISLSTWLRDYLYIPLGGNRIAPVRLYYNIIIVFLICGFWHGANWTFISWGLIHGLYLVFGHLTRKARARIAQATGIGRNGFIHKGLQISMTFILVSLAWIFFRAASLSDAVYIFSHLYTGWIDIFDANAMRSIILMRRPVINILITVLSLLFLWFVHLAEEHGNMRYLFGTKPLWFRWSVYYIMLTAVLLLSAPDTQKFIYFQF
jgi:alginate O-acetyltransferase complex protein AlgI